jgi:hypothetical protein
MRYFETRYPRKLNLSSTDSAYIDDKFRVRRVTDKTVIIQGKSKRAGSRIRKPKYIDIDLLLAEY